MNTIQKQTHKKDSSVKTVRASLIGTVVEYYDFGIYGYMATVLAALFFVKDDPAAGLLGTFATFAVAFIVRIPGGILFGHIGDKYGRKRALSLTILLMAGATAAIGMLPGYVTLGVWATAILVLCRCIQGIAAGGELGGAMAFVAEKSPAHARGFQTSVVNAGTYLGSLSASLVALLLNTVFTPEQVLEIAWRIPFLLSLVLGLVGVWLRTQLHDTESFLEMQAKNEIAEVPFKALVSNARGTIVKITGLGAFIVGGYYVCSIYAASYMQTSGHLTAQQAFWSTCVALTVGVGVLMLSGYLGDRFGRKRMMAIGVVVGLVGGVPAFMLMASGTPFLATCGQVLLVGAVATVSGSSFSTYAELLEPQYRYTGIALGNNLTNLTLGGTAPFFCELLVRTTGSSLSPAFYMVGCAAITALALFFIPETSPAKRKRVTAAEPGTADLPVKPLPPRR
ncbi:MFS transporter [Arthrobacter sp. 135MFCol5.1]|uniref:MFS transporter n=1 Tax=Arthrobacter sp. 135MFCol5.1 TaxID=1158050 RepID=UPI0003709B01|nr:MFS transporter [Arthrobacter sp. 135MFCol5.1]